MFQGGRSFYGWLYWAALLGRLSTKDRLRSWGLLNDSSCVLCNGDLESRSHLFLNCQFASLVWMSVISKCGLPPHSWDFGSEIDWGSNHCKDSSIRSSIFKLRLAASVYYIWKERNGRIRK